MITSVMCVENIYPATMMNRSSLSAIVALCLNETPFLIKTAVPLALDENEEWKDWPIHLSLERESFLKCVSCKNMMSVFIDFKCDNTLLRLTGWFRPLTFQGRKGQCSHLPVRRFTLSSSHPSYCVCYLPSPQNAPTDRTLLDIPSHDSLSQQN